MIINDTISLNLDDKIHELVTMSFFFNAPLQIEISLAY